jgi:DNA mismatch repair protein MutL
MDFEYLGQIFGVFLMVRRGAELLLVDFHAAHERILFDRFRSGLVQQRLLLPVRLQADDASAMSERLLACRKALRERGIVVEEDQEGWMLEAVPACFGGNTELVLEALESDQLSLESLDRSLFATLACRTARKDGDILSPDEAKALLAEALALPEPRCPHGRPVWFSLSKDELFELVGRKV